MSLKLKRKKTTASEFGFFFLNESRLTILDILKIVC